MKNISVTLNLLLFCLRKKLEKLEEIKNCTVQQGEKEGNWSELFIRKQELIAEIQKLDAGFDSTLAEVLPILQADPVSYAETIRLLQQGIADIAEVSAQIRRLEKKNYADRRLPVIREEIVLENTRLPKRQALGKYQKMKK